MTDLAASAGQRLKAERERRGLSSQKAADELLLDEWVIVALEADDYQRVGAPVYAKGHLKRYAALLGLPADDMLAAYESSRVQAPKPPAETANVRMLTDAPAVINLSQSQMIGTAAAVLLLAAVLWWKPWQQRGARRAVSASTPASVPASNSAEPALPVPEPQSKPKLAAASPGSPAASAMVAAPTPAAGSASAVAASGAAASPAGAEAADAAAGTGRARLRLSFSADSWVDIYDASGRRAFAGHGRANSVKTIAGNGPMRVYLGFASGVQLEINNRAVAIGPQFLAGDVARFEAGADGVLRRDTRSLATPTAQTRTARPIG
jgi:cytoskeleton protein RodZ